MDLSAMMVVFAFSVFSCLGFKEPRRKFSFRDHSRDLQALSEMTVTGFQHE